MQVQVRERAVCEHMFVHDVGHPWASSMMLQGSDPMSICSCSNAMARTSGNGIIGTHVFSASTLRFSLLGHWACRIVHIDSDFLQPTMFKPVSVIFKSSFDPLPATIYPRLNHDQCPVQRCIIMSYHGSIFTTMNSNQHHH